MSSNYASVCVLSFNRPELLAHTLKTMTAFADAPFELIVHDDGSTEPRTVEYLQDMIRNGHISTLILNPPGHNQGQGVALNRMFRMATGDPILKIDQDLIFNLGWLREINRILDDNEGGLLLGDPYIGLLGLLHYHHDPVDTKKTLISRWPGWQQHTHILGSAFAVRREAWEALGPFQEHSEAFAEDWAFQQAVTGSDGFVCALPDHDLCTNVGMGIGPSTVNTRHGVQTICKGPVLIRPEDSDQ